MKFVRFGDVVINMDKVLCVTAEKVMFEGKEKEIVVFYMEGVHEEPLPTFPSDVRYVQNTIKVDLTLDYVLSLLN